MKEATGELNSTIVVVMAIAGLMALFSIFIFPMVMEGFDKRAVCADAICDKGYIRDEYLSYCYSPKDTDTNKTLFTCPYRG